MAITLGIKGGGSTPTSEKKDEFSTTEPKIEEPKIVETQIAANNTTASKTSNKKGKKTASAVDGNFDAFSELTKEFGITEFDSVTLTASTGFDLIDALLSPSKTNRGLILRTLNTNYGNSGSGKTTFQLQIAANIQKQFLGAKLFLFDAEKSSIRERLLKLGIDPKRFIHIKKDTSIEGFFKMLKIIAKEREAQIANYGEEYVMSNPYIVVADSFSAMPSEKDVEADTEINSSMGTAARLWSQLLKVYMNILFKYNITILGVNQVRAKIDIMGQPKPKQLLYMKQDEEMAGGKSIPFYSNTFARFQTTGRLDPVTYGIDGFETEINFLKSRGSPTNRPVKMIFFPDSGFSNFWTNYEFLKSKKVIVAGAWNKLAGYEGSFRTVEAENLFNTNEAFKNAFQTALDIELDKFIREFEEFEKLNPVADVFEENEEEMLSE